jgi:lysophospholipase L1-like esterase
MVDGQLNNLMKKIIAINFLMILILILSLEIISNLFKLSNLMGIQDGLIYNKEGTNYLNPNKKKTVFNEDVFTDNFGYRVPGNDYKYLNDTNIFLLGDSVSFGNGVKEEETFVGLLRKQIDKKNLLNSSVPGYQMKDHLNIIKIINKLDNVEKVIYFYTLNDIYGMSNVISAKDKSNIKIKSNESDFGLKKIMVLNRINTFLRNKSYLYMLIKGLGTDPSKRWFLNLYPKYLVEDLDELKKNFENLKVIAQNNQSEFIIVILPYEYQTRSCTSDILIPQKKIRNILDSLDITYVDLTDDFCNDEKPKNKFYKFDPMHLSKKGHALVYNNLKNEINF